MTSDAARIVANVAAATALLGVPTIGPRLLGTAENAGPLDTPVTPPDRTFAVWGPIFLACLSGAVEQARPSRWTHPEHRSTGWPLAAAYGLNAAWSVAAQSDAWRVTPALLVAAAGSALLAHARLQQVGTVESASSISTGMLLGWTSLAATINMLGAPRVVGRAPSPLVSGGCVLAASAGLAGLIRHSRRGREAVAATALWGLSNVAVDRSRPAVARAASGLGALVVGAAAVLPSASSRRGSRRTDRYSSSR